MKKVFVGSLSRLLPSHVSPTLTSRFRCTGSHVQVVGVTVVLPQFLLVEKFAVSYEDVDIPIVMQRPILMVQRWIIEIISQLQFVLGGRCPCFAVVQVSVLQLQFILVVFNPVVAQYLSYGPDSSSDHRYSPVADMVVDVLSRRSV